MQSLFLNISPSPKWRVTPYSKSRGNTVICWQQCWLRGWWDILPPAWHLWRVSAGSSQRFLCQLSAMKLSRISILTGCRVHPCTCREGAAFPSTQRLALWALFFSLGLEIGGNSHKESACQCRRSKRCEFDPRLGRSPGVGNGNPL